MIYRKEHEGTWRHRSELWLKFESRDSFLLYHDLHIPTEKSTYKYHSLNSEDTIESISDSKVQITMVLCSILLLIVGSSSCTAYEPASQHSQFHKRNVLRQWRIIFKLYRIVRFSA
jgi:hypothetical protein